MFLRYSLFKVGQRIVLPQASVRWTLAGRKKPQPFVAAFVFALLIFPGRPRYRHGVGTVRWTVPAVGRYKRLKAATFVAAFVFALLIFPGSRPPSIVSAHELNFCVRDGNRWTLMTINTNSFGWVSTHLLYIKSFAASNSFGDPYRIRTDVNGGRGRCLNHLTNGPLVHLQGLEPGTH